MAIVKTLYVLPITMGMASETRKTGLNQNLAVLFLLKKCERRNKINNKWVEGTPNPDLLEDFLPVNQFQLYHVKYACV